MIVHEKTFYFDIFSNIANIHHHSVIHINCMTLLSFSDNFVPREPYYTKYLIIRR